MGRAAARSLCYTLMYHRETHQAMLAFAHDGLRAESSIHFISLKPALTHPTSYYINFFLNDMVHPAHDLQQFQLRISHLLQANLLYA